LKDNWSPAFTVSKVLLSVTALLTDCNPGNVNKALIRWCTCKICFCHDLNP